MANGSRGPRRQQISEGRKHRWFARGATALAKQFPDVPATGYCCPLCFHVWDSPEAFTVEDVPPRRVDGVPLVLTCQRCTIEGAMN